MSRVVGLVVTTGYIVFIILSLIVTSVGKIREEIAEYRERRDESKTD